MVVAAVLVLLGLVAAGGAHLFQSWRARDLAGKALRNLEGENFRMAWLQLNSARALRPGDPAVLRASAIIESRFGMPTAMDYWERLATRSNLSPEDLGERGRTALRFGSAEQFVAAVGALEESGKEDEAARLRIDRMLRQGEIDAAITATLKASDAGGDRGLKLDAARLLVQRHMDRLALARENGEPADVTGEIAALVEACFDAPEEAEALALGLSYLDVPATVQSAWIERAMKYNSAENPALLPGASAKVATGQATAAEIYTGLRGSFDAASLERRAAFAIWLTRYGMPREALTLITAQEASETGEAFVARVEALAALESWSAVIETVNAGGKAAKSAQLAAKARAEYALGYDQSGAQSAAETIRVAAAEGNLATAVAMVDAIGAGTAVDTLLVEVAGDPRVADSAFRLARDRFTRQAPGGGGRLAAAAERVAAVAPTSPALLDYHRYRNLVNVLGAEATSEDEAGDEEVIIVEPDETLEALEASPGDAPTRITHALALVKAGRSAEAAGLFEEFTLYFNRLPPPLQASLSAVMSAGGQGELAVAMASRVNTNCLTPQETRLLRTLERR